MLFIPFLDLLFNQSAEPVTIEPTFEYTKEYVTAYFNYTMHQYIEANDKVAALLFVCVLVGILFFLR